MPTVVRQLVPFATLLVLAALVALASPWAALALLVGVAVGAVVHYRRALRPKTVLIGVGSVAVVVAALLLSGLSVSPGHKSGGGARVLPAAPVLYHGAATYDTSKQSWTVVERFDVPPRVFSRYGAHAWRMRRLLTRAMRASGWAVRRSGPTIQYRYQGAQAVRPPSWRLLKTIELHLRTAAPDPDFPALVAGPGSVIVLDAPRRMIRATFPSLAKREDMLNGQDEIRVPLEVDQDRPQTVLRLKATSRLGRSAIGSQTLDLVAASWFKWLLGVVGFVRGLLWKRFRRLLRSIWPWARERQAEAPRSAA